VLLCHELIGHFVRVSVVGMEIKVPVGRSGLRIPIRAIYIYIYIYLLQRRPDRLYGPPSLLINGYRVLPSLPACSPDVYGVVPLLPLYEFMAWTRKPLPSLGKLYHIHLNKVATKQYSGPTCICQASYMIQYLQTNIISCFL
jgi:hypothetical protein